MPVVRGPLLAGRRLGCGWSRIGGPEAGTRPWDERRTSPAKVRVGSAAVHDAEEESGKFHTGNLGVIPQPSRERRLGVAATELG